MRSTRRAATSFGGGQAELREGVHGPGRHTQCMQLRVRGDPVDLEAEMLSTGHLAPEILAVTQECRNRFRAPAPAPARARSTTQPGKGAIERMDRFALHVDGTELGADFGGSETVCVTATITNPTDYDVMPMGIFSLALPSGRVEYMAGTEDFVPFPAVASAGSASGTVCFLTHGERGPAELRYNTPVVEKSWPVTIG